MIKILQFCVLAFCILLFTNVNAAKKGPAIKETGAYNQLITNQHHSLPGEEVFSIALKGMESLKQQSGMVRNDILTIIDFSLPSTEKRMWIIDLHDMKVLINDYVAHGRNSGNKSAEKFSNVSGSYMSSIGFYVTGDTYQGKHGLSLYLDGMDKNFNCNARNRAIVMHGADYVNSDFISQTGRLGRSLGCPAVSMDILDEVINTIQGGSTLFIYYPDPLFLEKSEFLKSTTI